jgi:ergothioneine biosynthesis protein EgtB
MQLEPDELRRRYVKVRTFSEQLCEPLCTEDHVVQSMPDASPTKWHLAHTTWFFDKFILQELFDQEPYDKQFNYLFNSYYNGAGKPFPRERRGMITRPGVDAVYAYRKAIDDELQDVIAGGGLNDQVRLRVEVGLNHEQQHQELLLTDLKHLMWQNPLRPAVYAFEHEPFAADRRPNPRQMPRDLVDGGVYEIGHQGDEFSYDNERPRHEVLVPPFKLARRPVTCAEYLQFMNDGGYERHDLWLSEGWSKLEEDGWNSPMYWDEADGDWYQYTLSGRRPVQLNEPVVHVNFYEAQAFAQWAGARLPSEIEWEIATQQLAEQQVWEGNFVESGRFHPHAVDPDPQGFHQLFGDVWEWTSSSYGPYPGFEPFDGALGEYNGKFMCSQYVLRGGSCATSRSHIRSTYRNFFYPGARWQFSGIRLAWSLVAF